MSLLNVSSYIDNFFEQRNGELKFSRKLVNKEYSKKIGIGIFLTATIIINILCEGLANIGLNKTPNYILGAIVPHPKYMLIYIVVYFVVGAWYIKLLFNIRASFKEIDEGQKGTSRFTTPNEIDKQYRAVPIADEEYKGKGGIPIARGYQSYIDDNGTERTKEVMYIDDSAVNNLGIGTTRSGKGETLVVPAIDVYSRAEKKASFVINDPKGELIAMCKDTLEERGYEVLMLNLLQPINSMSYNPLELIKRAYKRKDYSEAQLLCKTLTNSIYFKPNVKDPFWQNSAMSLVNALILAICDECIATGEEEKITMYTVANMLSELGGANVNVDDKEVNLLDEYFKGMPADSVAKSQYATSSFAGGSARGNIFSVAMSELQTYTLEEIGKVTSKNSLDFENIGFYKTFKKKVTVVDSIESANTNLNNQDDNKNQEVNYEENIKKQSTYKNRVLGLKDLVIEKESSNIIIEEEIKISAYGQQSSLFDEINNTSNSESISTSREKKNNSKNKLKKKLLMGIKAFNVDGIDVTSEITIDVSEVKFDEVGEYEVEYKVPLERPKAVFMVTPDYDTSNHVLASIFVRQIYYVLAKTSSLNDTSKCDREVVFLLDEFGNMPSIEGMANIITVCLGRGIRFNLIIQAYSQLKKLYGEDASTIIGNCGNQIYILTNDDETSEKFSKLVGEKTIITNSRSGEVLSINKSQTESLENRRLLNSEELRALKKGDTVVVRVIKREDNKGKKIVPYPIFNTNEHSMKYRYEYLEKKFDNIDTVFKNVKVKSLHKDINLKDLIIDFSKDRKVIKEKEVDDLDENAKNIVKKSINSEETIKEKTRDNNNMDKLRNDNIEKSIISKLQMFKILAYIGNKATEVEKQKLKECTTKEDIIKYLEEINKIDLIENIEKILE